MFESSLQPKFYDGFVTRFDRRRGMSPVGASCVGGLWATTGVFTCGWLRLTRVWTTAGGLVGSTGTDGLSSTGAAFAVKLKESGEGTGLPDSTSSRGLMCSMWTTRLLFPGSLTMYVSGPSVWVTVPWIHVSLPPSCCWSHRLVHVKLWDMSGPSTITMLFFFLLTVVNLGCRLGFSRVNLDRGALVRNSSAGVRPVMLWGVFLYWNRSQKPDVAGVFEHVFECLHIPLCQIIWCRMVGWT